MEGPRPIQNGGADGVAKKTGGKAGKPSDPRSFLNFTWPSNWPARHSGTPPPPLHTQLGAGPHRKQEKVKACVWNRSAQCAPTFQPPSCPSPGHPLPPGRLLQSTLPPQIPCTGQGGGATVQQAQGQEPEGEEGLEDSQARAKS